MHASKRYQHNIIGGEHLAGMLKSAKAETFLSRFGLRGLNARLLLSNCHCSKSSPCQRKGSFSGA
eukprot:scaffold246947_cov18-Tisochrysis_lutea.AAC.1